MKGYQARIKQPAKAEIPCKKLKIKCLSALQMVLAENQTEAGCDDLRSQSIGFNNSKYVKRNSPQVVPGGGVEPPREVVSADFESAASASSAIPAG